MSHNSSDQPVVSTSPGGVAWNAFDLDSVLRMESIEFRNDEPSGFGDDQGEWFYAPPEPITIGGARYWILFTGTHGNDHSPGASHYTHALLYTDPVAWQTEVDRWDAMPEYLDSNDESADDAD